MDAPDLIFELRSKGYSIRADGGYLDISPADNIPPELVQNIRQSKAEILAALQSESTEPTNIRSLGSPMSGIGEGFSEWEFFHLPEDDKRKLLIIMARVAESHYRRGLQQGWWARDTNQKFRITPDKLRWGNHPLDSAKMPLCGTKMSSLERLRIQHGSILAALGFDTIYNDIQ